MAELKIYLSKDLNEKFRRMAMTIYGYGRGSISKAAEDALARWCDGHEHPRVVSAPSVNMNEAASATGKVDTGINPDERAVDPKPLKNESPERQP